MSSDYECCTDVIGKQTDGCHDDDNIDAGVGPMQPIVRVACSDMPSPDSDAEADSQNTAAMSAGDAASSVDHLPTMWLGAQSGR